MDIGFQPFVYGLVDPLDPGHVRYVGMAGVRASRPYDHAKKARASKKNSYVLNWIRSLQSEEREPQVIVLEEVGASSRSLLSFVEQCYIKSLREIGHRLTNITEGGDGGCTSLVTPEFRAKVGAASKRLWEQPEYRAKMKIARTGLKRSAEARANMRLAQKGRVITEDAKLKIAATLTGRKASNEIRAKQSASIKAAKSTPEARLAASIKGKAVWALRKSKGGA